MSFDFSRDRIRENIFDVSFGLEKECLRVDMGGYLAHTAHGFDDSHIQRDFCENQVEFVTDVFTSAKEVCAQLRELHKAVQTDLKARQDRELLWSFSNPPYVRDVSDIPIANFVGGQKGKSAYRKYLAEKYGKMKMLYSGIHFNFSFENTLLSSAFEYSGESDFDSFKDGVYLELAKKLVDKAWLLVYLTAASPVIDCSFIMANRMGESLVTSFSSARCSAAGYWNDFVPILSYASAKDYADSIDAYVGSGKLKSASELYYPIRLKPRGANSLDGLRERGINHIELRMLDLNPLSEIGIFEEDINFLHLYIMYLMSLTPTDFSEKAQQTAIKNEKTAALLDDSVLLETDGKMLGVKEAASLELASVERFYSQFDDAEINSVLSYQRAKIEDKTKRYANIVIEKFGKDYVKNGLLLAEKYQDNLTK